MWELALFAAGFLVVAAGLFSLIYPLRRVGIATRAIALVVIAAGFFLVALGAEMVDSYFVYLGFAGAFAGFVAVVRPLRFLYIRSRGAAWLVIALGLLLSVLSALLPYRETQVAAATTKLDEWMPRWQVDERHTIEIAAPPEKVFKSIHAVRADEEGPPHGPVHEEDVGDPAPPDQLHVRARQARLTRSGPVAGAASAGYVSASLEGKS